jgi:hypothetical protein
MKVSRRLAVAFAALALALSFGLTAAGTAHAAPVAPVTNNAGSAGYEAATLNTNQDYMTHITAQFGLGNPQYGPDNPLLPEAPFAVVNALNGAQVGQPFSVGGNQGSFDLPTAVRIGLDDGNGQYTTAQAAAIRINANEYDVIGVFGTAVTDHGHESISSGEAVVLLKDIPVSHTTEMDVLYDGRNNYDGYQAGTPTFFAHDLSAKHGGAEQVNIHFIKNSHNSEFFHAIAGIVNGPATVTTLGTAVPVAGTTAQIQVLLAHTFLNGNVIGGSEFFGTLQSSTDWTVVPDVFENHAGAIERGPGVFSEDHFSVYSGQ